MRPARSSKISSPLARSWAPSEQPPLHEQHPGPDRFDAPGRRGRAQGRDSALRHPRPCRGGAAGSLLRRSPPRARSGADRRDEAVIAVGWGAEAGSGPGGDGGNLRGFRRGGHIGTDGAAPFPRQPGGSATRQVSRRVVWNPRAREGLFIRRIPGLRGAGPGRRCCAPHRLHRRSGYAGSPARAGRRSRDGGPR